MEKNNEGIYESLKLVESVAREAQRLKDEAEHEPKIVHIHDRPYLYRNGMLHEIKEPEYYPDRFDAFTLNGLIDWIKADTDKLFAEENPPALVVVGSETEVYVLSHAQTKERNRVTYARCVYDAPHIPFNRYADSEELNVILQTCFLQDDNRDLLLTVVNNITEEQSIRTADDGISQRVTVTTGVEGVDSKVFKNPAYLRPMRTFTEVWQPASPFIVRFKEGKMAALFEADGGKWKVEAVKAIGAYLERELEGQNVVVIA